MSNIRHFRMRYIRITKREIKIRNLEESRSMSMNMYQLIGSAKLGNLSALPMIPIDYIKMLLAYIIQISRAFSHTHNNGLIHGNFNLSKVISQSFSSQSPLQKKASNKQMNLEKPINIFNTSDIYNYFLVNFEPWQVQLLMQK